MVNKRPLGRSICARLSELNDLSYGIFKRPVGLFESAEKMVVVPYHLCFIDFGCPAGHRWWQRGGPVYLHYFLKNG